MRKRGWVSGTVFVVILTGTVVFSAYHHEGEIDSPHFLAVYPEKAGTKLDHCALCHTGGSYESRPGSWVSLGSCQWCHYSYGYDGSGNIVDTLNEYGMDYLIHGRSEAALRAIEGLDSDGDGYTNIEEIRANRYPGDSADDPSMVPAPSKIYSRDDLEAMTRHTQFLLMNASRSDDKYAEYTGVPMEDLLKDAGILGTATGITVYAPDGWAQYHPLTEGTDPEFYHVNGTYPGSYYYYDTEADMMLNPADGWCDYSAPSCQGRKHLDPIVNSNGNKMILAYKREGQYMDPGVLNLDNKLDGEGPFRVVPPQKNPGPPDQRSTAGNQSVIWPYNRDGDHNAGAATRTVTIIRVEPLPPGTTDINVLEAGWTYVDEGKVIVYGAIGQRGGSVLVADLGTMGLWAYDGSTWKYVTGSNPGHMTSWKDGLAVSMGASGIFNYDGAFFTKIGEQNAENIAGWEGGLAMDLGASGLWNLNNGAAEQISPFDPQGMMVGWGGHLYVDFGPSGIWVYDGAELAPLLYGFDPESITGWTGGLAVDFGGRGLWNWDGSEWTLIIDFDTGGLTSWSRGLAVDFGSYGLWNYDGADWSFITFAPESATGWAGNLALAFGAFGLWNYDGSNWTCLTPAVAEALGNF